RRGGTGVPLRGSRRWRSPAGHRRAVPRCRAWCPACGRAGDPRNRPCLPVLHSALRWRSWTALTQVSMTVLAVSAPDTGGARYTLRIAADAAEIAAAQRLRHRVFAEELGVTLHTPTPGHDIDEFDAYCDHLIAVEETVGEVVGTYRMLPPGRAPRR